MEPDKCRKAFNFDLVIAELKQHYPDGHHTKAYKDVQGFMTRNGFAHRQGSGYLSKEPLSDLDVIDLIDRLQGALPWFAQCVNKFDVTDVGEMYDLKPMFRVAAPASGKKTEHKPSMKDRMAAAKEETDRRAAERSPEPGVTRSDPEL